MVIFRALNVTCLLVVAGCTHEPMTKKDAVLNFLHARKYAYVTSVAAIPSAAMHRIEALEGTLRICDVESGLPINLTDVHLSVDECTSKLNFALVGDSVCLLSYLKGGIGVSQVVYCIKYKGKPWHVKYTVLEEVNDTVQLDRVLRKQINSPLQESSVLKEDSKTMLKPPPPWPQKTTKTRMPLSP